MSSEVAIDSDGELSQLIAEFDSLLRGAKNFNLHVNVLKKLLNLKERPLAIVGTSPLPPPSTISSASSSEKIIAIREKMHKLKKEVEESHLLGFCLAFNIQRLQQRLTGSPVDATAADKMIDSLWERFNKSKNSEAMLKYEFEEKRKLLRKLRHQLEQTRRDWKNFKIRKSDPPSEEEQTMWSQLREDFARRARAERTSSSDDAASDGAAVCRSASEADSAVHSDDGEGESPNEDRQPINLLLVFDERKHRLDQLEEECCDLVNHLARRRRHGTSASDASASGEEDSTARYHSPTGVDLFGDDEDTSPSEDAESDDFDEAPLAEEAIAFAELDIDINSGLIDDTEDAEMSDLPWDTSAEHSTATQTTLLPPEIQISSPDSTHESRASSQARTDDEEEHNQRIRESLAETGEPIVLCRLRRKAVEILISRLREEKKFHETREDELRQQMIKLKEVNGNLQSRVDSSVGDQWFRWPMAIAVFGVAITVANLVALNNLFV